MNLKGNQDEFGFAGTHEYTVVYAKNKSNLIIKEFPISNEEFAGWSEDEIGYYKKGANLKATGVNAPRTKRPFLYYPILVHVQSLEVSTISKEEFSKIYDPSKKSFNDSYVDELKKMYEERGYAFLLPLTDNQGMSWRWGRDKVENESHEIIVVGDNGSYSLYKKQRPEVGELPTKKPKTLFYKPEYSSGNGTTMLKAIFGDKVFQNPKPVDLIFDFLQISSDSPSLILDSFAGSGTTAHAVLNLNKKDGGKRKFILIEMEEYAESITAERVKRVINGYGEGKGVVEGTGGGFDYYELGERYFDEAGNLNEDLGIERIREYIWYSETGNNGDRICSAIDYYLGRNKNTDYYFYYEREEITTLTEETLRQMLRQRAEQYVVYADICMMSEELLRARNVVFKKIPRDIKKM